MNQAFFIEVLKIIAVGAIFLGIGLPWLAISMPGNLALKSNELFLPAVISLVALVIGAGALIYLHSGLLAVP